MNATAAASIWPGHGFGRRRRLPMLLQTEAAECGLAAVAMVACYYGHDFDLPSLRQRESLSLKGMTLTQLIAIAGRLDLATRSLRIEMEHLRHLRTPCILHWDLNHFVVLKQATAKFLVIHDPAQGVRRMHIEEASKHVTGVALGWSYGWWRRVPLTAYRRAARAQGVLGTCWLVWSARIRLLRILCMHSNASCRFHSLGPRDRATSE